MKQLGRRAKYNSPTLELVHAFYDRIWNEGNTQAADELLTEDFAFRGSLGAESCGPGMFCEYVRSVRAALEGYRCEVLECVTEGPRAFARMRFSGHHTGPFRGFAPTGRRLEWQGAALFTVRERSISELWVLGDLKSLDASLEHNAVAHGHERGDATNLIFDI